MLSWITVRFSGFQYAQFQIEGLKSQNRRLFLLRHALWKFKSPRGWAHFSRLNFWKLAVRDMYHMYITLALIRTIDCSYTWSCSAVRMLNSVRGLVVFPHKAVHRQGLIQTSSTCLQTSLTSGEVRTSRYDLLTRAWAPERETSADEACGVT